MTYKLPALAGASIAVLAVLAPLAFAHDDTGGVSYPSTDASDKPSGHYAGAAGPYFENRDGSATTDVVLAGGNAFCDLEVLGDGTGNDANDETLVDGNTGGSAADGV